MATRQILGSSHSMPATNHRRTGLAAVIAAAVIAGAAALAAPALAQQAQQSPQPQQGQEGHDGETVATHGDWSIRCQTMSDIAAETGAKINGADGKGDQAGNKRQCAMVQTVLHEENRNVGMSVVVLKMQRDDQVQTTMRIMAPVGVFLPTGVALEIDGSPVGRIGFTRCLPQVCIANADMSEELLGKLRKGGKANFIIYRAPGVGIGLLFSLNGFTAAFDSLGSL